MPTTLLDIVMFMLMLSALGSLVYWGAVAAVILKTNRELPTAKDGIAIADRNPPGERVCVIVPAHNEAGNIAKLIASLKAQDYDRLTVVLALDRCTDDTAGVAREAIGGDHRFEIIQIDSCPDDWAGKVHAAHSGVTRSQHARSADVYLFSDADTWFDPSCVRATVALANERKLDMLSLLSTLKGERWYERWVQPATAFELARQYPLLRVNITGDRQRPFANGQFMLFKTEAYNAIGGHEAVKHAVLEDIAFSQALKYKGKAGGLLMADGILHCGMYDSWSEFVRGWKRIYTESANREVTRLRRYAIRIPVLNAGLPILAIACVIIALVFGDPSTKAWAGGLGAGGFIAWFVAVIMMLRVSHAPASQVLGFAIGSFFVSRLFWQAANDLESGTPTQWGGKSYVRPVAGKGN
ncbi:MAG: glycosyltransferase family 2 protein [Phycisphaerales bacterium]